MTLIRPLTEEDRPLIEQWISGEPAHQNNTFEFYTEAGCKGLMFGDDAGDVLTAKFTPCLRIDLEFNPEAGPKRISRVMSEGLANMEDQARKQGFKEFVFDSLSEKLVKFCDRFGFRPSPDYRKVI